MGNGIVDIVYEGNNIKLDLNKKVPFDLLKKNYKGQTYIAAPLVRAICLGLKIWPTNIQSNTFMWDSWVIVSVSLDIDWVSWFAQDYIGGKSVAMAMMANSAKVVALAIKAALRFKYPFFEGEWFEDAEWIMPEVEAEPVKVEIDSGVDGYTKWIANAKTATDLNKIGVSLAKDTALSKDAKKNLRALYVKKNKELW